METVQGKNNRFSSMCCCYHCLCNEKKIAKIITEWNWNAFERLVRSFNSVQYHILYIILWVKAHIILWVKALSFCFLELTLLNKYKLTVIAALAHRQMHLSVMFRFHCTTKADHAIDLSPWMVFRVLNWFDYRINLCMIERTTKKSDDKPPTQTNTRR